MILEGWMSLQEFCDKHRQPKSLIHKRVSEGLWPRGELYAAPDGSSGFVHEQRALAWLKERGLERT